MTNFSSNWVRQGGREIKTSEKIKENLTQQPLKTRMETAKNKIELQNHKLNNTLENLRGKEKTLFNQVVSNLQKHDVQQVKMLSNELIQVKNTTKMISQLKMAVEQAQLRLESTINIGDVMTSLSPAVGALTKVRSTMRGLMPEVDAELGEVNRVFSDVLMNAGNISNNTLFALDSGNSSDEDVNRILSEASAVAEQRMNENLPNIPVESSFSNGSRSSVSHHSQ
jgi:division protein CdvB (Snf7/Vps24/ESCRT-III family)